MFFKRIEMTGFKSFVHRTDVLFKPGVTVIVGPNGCGKSNIFDAVRWVLGEQSAKSLRGESMSDVIFNGTDTHRATAFAQVSLTVSNEDRRLPIDFNEVVISRRLTRTGESEYAINRHRCRLRDVVELFMDTGVGTNAYSIMEQGRIDQIINARPADRREIFEEAAGVSKYRVRRAETQRRLARTEADLIRLVDVIAEVKRQANSLRRQRNRAERYKRFESELRGLEMHLLAHRWRRHQDEGKGLVDEIAVVENRLAEVTAKLARLEAEQEQGIQRTEELNRVILEGSTQINAKSTTIHDTEKEISLLHQRREINTARLGELEVQITGSRETLAELSATLERLTGELAEREAAFAEREHVHALRREESQRARAGLDAQERELGDLRRRISESRTQQLNLENEIRLAAVMGEKLTDEIGVINAQREEQARLAEEANRALAEREGAHGEEAKRLEGMTERLETIDARLGDLRDEEQEVTEALRVCQSDLTETQSHLRALRALQRSHEGYREGVRLVMQAAESDELEGIVGTVASLIHPHPEHERALEAALNGDEQIILTRTAEDRQRAAAWLRGQSRGRATLLALDSAREPHRPMGDALSLGGVIAWADTAVTCDDLVRPAVRELLSETLIVADMETALRLSANGTARRCVTPEGEIAIGGTRVTAGPLQATGLLTRERDIAVAGEREARLVDELTGLRRREASLTESRREIEAERHDLASARQRQEILCAELAKDLEMARRESAAVQATLERLRLRAEDIDRQIDEQLDLRESAAERLDDIRAEIASQEERISTMEGMSVNSGAEARRLEEEAHALEIEVARAREQLEMLRLRHSSCESEHTEISRRIGTADSECTRLTSENEEAHSRLGTLEERLTALFEERRALEESLSTQRQESDQASIELKRLGQEVHVTARERNELQNRLHDLDVKRSQHEMHLEHCDEEAKEKFGRPMAQVLSENPDPIEDLEAHRSQAAELRQRIEALGPVNVMAIEEYEQLRQRHEFLSAQESDLLDSKRNLERAIQELDQTTTQIFGEAFTRIRENFQSVFRRLFGGGRADLLLTEPNDPVTSGVEIVAQPPSKKLSVISLLSGGEKALTAIALLFAIFQHKPAPFCVLDEMDAPLDDKNIGRFKDMLNDFSQSTQFIIITHNKHTMRMADTLLGITMEEKGVSRLVGVDLHTATQLAE
ncbi:chromosome segregation protein SMC [Candidatus Sumerlaeota bacterium]|nr:chromosome segregation protein SMC [Candidatus Sumerlaeota bacterium]